MPRPVGFTLEDEGAKKKWDAWKREEGVSRTEAKRRYISYLIETMRIYASGTLEARELLSELEYLWDQIKDLQYTPDSDSPPMPLPLPSHSPSFSHTDRYSTTTPLPPPSNYSGSGTQYRNNLQKIYSHSRRNTMLSINEYVQSQRLQQSHGGTHSVKNAGPGDSVYSAQQGNAGAGASSLDEFKSWQGEVNLMINKLSRDIVNYKRHRSESSESSDQLPEARKRALKTLRAVGSVLLRIAKNFSISCLTLLFLVWCIKRNVIVKQTLIKKPNNKHKELVINMVLNTDENKWFIRLLNLINSFVGFV
ncbi:hypothetical protein PGUG_00658 [Meyerozyma guilliermondii ATCC 6260]|uniref:ACB domain-containing protein n=1 Tax=Meyerozyma guilliermondii (strain ATCC 6260 / CBS 566 / DSM 6381 / JCM 1539 / NBRC 10279 / NRRL Y-324) TaxID=294746 RepID=A5DBK3_PICGU|nr:uncharacterized protein PGUG_00658 [Meyerozyma guilliermondii ATCC 6260]EDK36560.2 hypothetical protein PGUG_00658 [Meyerozyma guilliermondii ATCC 6260]